MYLPSDEFNRLTPASSHASSATMMPSNSVASSKNYGEPERGRSLSRSSSTSSSSSSGILLSPRSSIDSPIPAQFHGSSHPNGSSLFSASYPVPSDGPMGGYAFRQGYLQGLSAAFTEQPRPDVRTSVEPTSTTVEVSDLKGKNLSPALPGSVPSMDKAPNSRTNSNQPSVVRPYAWGLASQAATVPEPHMGLFGPPSPRDSDSEFCSNIGSPTPLSAVTELSEPSSVPLIPHPYSHHIERGFNAPPIIVSGRSRSTSPYSRRSPVASNIPQAPIVSWSGSRSPGRRTPPPVVASRRPQPHIVCRRSPSRSQSSERRSPAPPIIIQSSRSPAPPIVIQSYPHFPAPPVIVSAGNRSRSRSNERRPIIQPPYRTYERSRSRSRSSERPTIIVQPSQPKIIVSQPCRGRYSPPSRSRSPQTTPMLTEIHSSSRRSVPTGFEYGRVGIERVNRDRSRSYSPDRHRRPIVLSGARSRSRSPVWAAQRHVNRSRSPRIYRRSRSRSRSPRQLVYVPGRSRSRSRSPPSPRYHARPHRVDPPSRGDATLTPCVVLSPPSTRPSTAMLSRASSSTGRGDQAPRVNKDAASSMSALTEFLRSNGIRATSAPVQVHISTSRTPGGPNQGQGPPGQNPSPGLLINPNPSAMPLPPAPPPATDNLFSADFIQSVAGGLDAFDVGLFRGDGDLNFERDFGQWFNPDDVESMELGSRNRTSRAAISRSRSRTPVRRRHVQISTSRTSGRSRSRTSRTSISRSRSRTPVRRRRSRRRPSPSTSTSSTSSRGPPIIIQSASPMPFTLSTPGNTGPAPIARQGWGSAPGGFVASAQPHPPPFPPAFTMPGNAGPAQIAPPAWGAPSGFPTSAQPHPPPFPTQQFPLPPWAQAQHAPMEDDDWEPEHGPWVEFTPLQAPFPPYHIPSMEYHPSGHGPVYCGMPPPFLPRHPRFWHADGNLQIHLGNMEYRLHRYLFNKARSFPTLWGAPLEPLYLSESKIDFDRFLSVLYPLDYSEEECKTAEEWASVLRLADKWSMQDVRRLAINRLESCAGPVDKIALGHRYNVPNWLGPAYLALAMRKEPVTSAEGLKMGVEALVRIAALKDDVFANLTEYVDQNKFAELFASKLAM